MIYIMKWVRVGDFQMQWIVFTHVCQRWRRIALDRPALWTHIPILSRRWGPEFFLRSKTWTVSLIWIAPALESSQKAVSSALMNSILREGLSRASTFSISPNRSYSRLGHAPSQLWLREAEEAQMAILCGLVRYLCPIYVFSALVHGHF